MQATAGALLLTGILGLISGVRLGSVQGLIGGGLLIGSLLLHEIGHVLMAQSFGVRVKAVGICLKGAYTRRLQAPLPGVELAIAAAGPASNLLLFFWLRDGNSLMKWVAMLNLVLAISNLVPLRYSDGARIVESWRALRRTSSA